MGISIQTNLMSLNAQRNMQKTQSMLESSMSRLSSGYRITRAGDDAAGLAIAENLEAQIKSYNQAARNALDGLSLIQTAEGALNETTNILQRLRELAMQSASDGVSDTERGYIQKEVDQLIAEVDRIANATEYNGEKLLNAVPTGTPAAMPTLTFQVGIRNVAANDRISVSKVNVTAVDLGLKTGTDSQGNAVTGISLATAAGAQSALTTIDTAIEKVNGFRADFGAAGNRLQSTVSNIRIASENLSAAHSRIRDVDVAEETSRLARAQVLMQAGTAVLAQANQMPQVALRLLG